SFGTPKTTGAAGFYLVATSAERGRRDSNPQPPDPQTKDDLAASPQHLLYAWCEQHGMAFDNEELAAADPLPLRAHLPGENYRQHEGEMAYAPVKNPYAWRASRRSASVELLRIVPALMRRLVSDCVTTSFPKLHGAASPSNLSTFSNAQIGTYYKVLFSQFNTNRLDAEVLSLALYIFAPASSLGMGADGTTPATAYGLQVDVFGLGAYSFNI